MDASFENYGLYSKEMFAQGTVGRAAFPDELEGRTRTLDPLQKPVRIFLTSLVPNFRRVNEANLFTLKDLAQAEEQAVLPLLFRPQAERLATVENLIQQFLLDQALYSPWDNFMSALFTRFNPRHLLIDPDREPFRDQLLKDLLNRLPEFTRAIIALRFGLDNGRPISERSARKILNIDPRRYWILQGRALAQARMLRGNFFLHPFTPDPGVQT